MSELQPHFEGEKLNELDQKNFEKANDEAAEKRREAAEKAAEHDLRNSLEAIQERVEKAARSKAEVDAADGRAETYASESPIDLGTQFKGHAYQQQIQRVQQKEKPAERAFSKFIHQPVIEEISQLAEDTIARPSGLLAGGLFSAVSSLLVLWICRHYGYEYNFIIGLGGFVAGFVIGLLVEGIWRLFRRP
ncbi:MAG: hypothetical protein ACR2FM_05780 [Candidatus Saccharimonadales bacterium]